MCNHLSCGETASAPFAPENTSSPNCTPTRTHIQLMSCFLKGSSSSRGGTSLLAATYDPPPPIIHTHTQARQPTLSLPLYSKLDFFSSSLSLPFFSSPPFSAGCSFMSNLIPPSLTASTSLPLSALLHIFVLFQLCSLLLTSFLLLLFYLFHCYLLLLLLFASLSQYPQSS